MPLGAPAAAYMMQAQLKAERMVGDFGQIARYGAKGAEEFVDRSRESRSSSLRNRGAQRRLRR
jgi:hypothetical protein